MVLFVKSEYNYDQKGRLKEVDEIGTTHINKSLYIYNSKENLEKIKFYKATRDNEIILRIERSYSDYELDKKGNWTRRTLITKVLRDNSTIENIYHRKIRYYK